MLRNLPYSRRRQNEEQGAAPPHGCHEERHGSAKEVPALHSGYKGEMQTLFAEFDSVTDNVATPTYTKTDDMIQALQGLHISVLLEFEDDDADEEEPDDIDAPLRALQSNTKDNTMGDTE